MRIDNRAKAAQLSALFKGAAQTQDTLAAKRLGTRSTDPLLSNGKETIGLQKDELEALLDHVSKLPDADKVKARDLLAGIQDIFQTSADTKKLLSDFVGKATTTPVEAEALPTTPAAELAKARTKKKPVPVKDLKDAQALGEQLRKDGGDALGDGAAKALKSAVQNGDVPLSTEDGGRKAHVAHTAKHAEALKMLDEYSNSPFFEDRLLAFMMRNGIKFMQNMDEQTAKFDDPKKLEDLKAAFNEAAAKMAGLADKLSPEGQARVASRLAEFVKANPEVAAKLPAYQQWIDKVKSTGALDKVIAAKESPLELLKELPPPDNAVIADMKRSDREEVRQFAAVFEAADKAEQLRGLTPGVIANMSEDDIRKTHTQMKEFAVHLRSQKGNLPDELQKQFPDISVGELPAQIDPTSRQIMFQQINMMMQQYQQIMQALSEIMNKMNEMAMDPIRKMGR